MSENTILFYSHNNGAYSCFSNFYHAEFDLDGKHWNTSEHYYMAQKTTDSKISEKIRKCASPREAKDLASTITLRNGWDDMKFEIMVKACYAKFSQNKELADILLSTDNLPIHENCKDPWWGGGPNFPKGKDLLGKALIRVRKMLRENK